MKNSHRLFFKYILNLIVFLFLNFPSTGFSACTGEETIELSTPSSCDQYSSVKTCPYECIDPMATTPLDLNQIPTTIKIFDDANCNNPVREIKVDQIRFTDSSLNPNPILKIPEKVSFHGFSCKVNWSSVNCRTENGTYFPCQNGQCGAAVGSCSVGDPYNLQTATGPLAKTLVVPVWTCNNVSSNRTIGSFTGNKDLTAGKKISAWCCSAGNSLSSPTANWCLSGIYN